MFKRYRVFILMKEGVMKEVNAKAFRAHRELRIMFAAWKLCVLRRLRPTI